MNHFKLNHLLLIVIVILISLLVYLLTGKGDKMPFIKLADVYKEFKLTKELDTKYSEIETKKKNTLDSLDFEAKKYGASVNYNNTLYQVMVQNYINRRSEFEKSSEELSQMYEDMIWKQINTYTEKYGKDNNYEYILGAQGSGTVMYANPKNDITKEFIEYLNRSYEGKAK
jgi:outer membrane protein